MLKWFISLVVWPTVFEIKLKVRMIIAITSTIASDTTSLMEGFHHPILSQEGMRFRGRLGLYYWADTSFLGKHAYVEEFVEA